MGTALEAVEDRIAALLERIRSKYGTDFRDYAPASMYRRIMAIIQAERLSGIDELESKILSDPAQFQAFIHGVSVSVTSMFRDPSFHRALRTEVIPLLATYPFVRIWHAGCSTGEEVYSMAIMLKEEGLYDRARIYATDMDAVSIECAKTGIFPLSSMKEYSENYLRAGGKESLSNYYFADQENALFSADLKTNIVFAQHNLASDSSFNEFHMILCRNVLIYFNTALRDRVLSLMHDSLIRFGVLALGSKESLRFTPISSCYEQIIERERIYKRVI